MCLVGFGASRCVLLLITTFQVDTLNQSKVKKSPGKQCCSSTFIATNYVINCLGFEFCPYNIRASKRCEVVSTEAVGTSKCLKFYTNIRNLNLKVQIKLFFLMHYISKV